MHTMPGSESELGLRTALFSLVSGVCDDLISNIESFEVGHFLSLILEDKAVSKRTSLRLLSREAASLLSTVASRSAQQPRQTLYQGGRRDGKSLTVLQIQWPHWIPQQGDGRLHCLYVGSQPPPCPLQSCTWKVCGPREQGFEKEVVSARESENRDKSLRSSRKVHHLCRVTLVPTRTSLSQTRFRVRFPSLVFLRNVRKEERKGGL